MKIQMLGYKDAEKYKLLRLQALQNHPEYFGSTYEQEVGITFEQTKERIRPTANKFTLGAYDDEQLVGLVTFIREFGEKTHHKGHVVGMYVTPEARRKGIGQAMLEKLFEYTRKIEGLEQLNLMVTSTNENAIAVYRSLGFEQYGIEKRAMKVDGRYVDELLMVKFL